MSEQEVHGRTPPRSEEAEKAVLGAVLLDPEILSDVTDLLKADDFWDKRHAAIFASVQALSDASSPIDFVSVGEALKARGEFVKVGGAEYLVQLAHSVTTSAHALYHAQMVADTATLRGVIKESTAMVREAYDTSPDGESVRNLLDACEQRMYRIARREEGSGVGPIHEAIQDTFRRLDAATHRDGLTGITTGFLDLDQLLCGLNKGELIILAARPSMGKTAFALNLVEHAALSRPEWLDGAKPTVLLFSLEMGRQQLVSRMLCCLARVDAHRLRTGRIPPEDRTELTNAAEVLGQSNIFIDDSSALSMMSLRSRARRLKAKQGLELIVVDYLQLLTFPKSENRLQEISNISRSLKGLSRELDVPVVALAQLSRAVEMRDPPRPQLADLRESGSIEQDADVVMLLYRADYYPKYRDEENLGVAEIIVAKQRNGPTGDVRLQFFNTMMRFEDRAPNITEAITL
ncbi:MAG: replicative DNA helicase [Planctomycetota bacterium]|jgi:replicative DNA helicase